MSEAARQLRRGLTQGLNFFTAQQLAKRAADERIQEALAAQRAKAKGVLDEQRLKTATELAKLGNLSAQAGLQNFVRTGEESALSDIGEFDQTTARNLMLAEKFGLPLAKEEQFAPANELLGRIGIQQPTGLTPTQQARIGAFDALRSLREMQANIDESISQARIAHLKALTKAANNRAEQISKEIIRAGKSGKITLDNVKSYNELLRNYQDILEGQLEAIGQMPDFYEDPIAQKVNPKYVNDLTNLLQAFERLRQQAEILSAFQAENTLPSVPYRNAPPYTPALSPQAGAPPSPSGDIVRQLLQGVLPQTTSGKPKLEWEE